MTLRLDPDLASISIACAALDRGELVAFPTETVYGLGADVSNADAVAAIYAAKGRPAFNPLIAHVADLDMALKEGIFDDAACTLAERFWPGPLTLVVPAQPDGTACELSRAGLQSVGLRCPAQPMTLALLSAFGRPLAGPSANRSGHVSPTTADHVLGDLDGKIAAVIDAGPCRVGIESTILGCADGRIVLLRPGSIGRAELEAACGQEIIVASEHDGSDAPRSPGRLLSHYAPLTPVRLNATEIRAGEAFLAFGSETITGAGLAKTVANLSPSRDLTEAAARLYSMLRALDVVGASAIAIAPIPLTGLGEAIADRLRRAAAT